MWNLFSTLFGLSGHPKWRVGDFQRNSCVVNCYWLTRTSVYRAERNGTYDMFEVGVYSINNQNNQNPFGWLLEVKMALHITKSWIPVNINNILLCIHQILLQNELDRSSFESIYASINWTRKQYADRSFRGCSINDKNKCYDSEDPQAVINKSNTIF